MSYSAGSKRTRLSEIIPRAMRFRLKGPGGLYNIGNVLGLGAGLGLQIAAGAGQSDTSALITFFAGSRSAVALTTANLVFLWSGEIYFRAWAQGAPPNPALNRSGDILSGYGALILGLGLFLTGQHMLALFSGALHALGKFGSAWLRRPAFWPEAWPDFYRTAVLASRIPAIGVALIGLGAWQTASSLSVLLAWSALLGSYVLWASADLLLFRASPAAD